MIERAIARAQRRDAETRPSNIEYRRVESLGVEMPTEMAAKFERHLMSKTASGRRTLTLQAEVTL
jgi:hypothetical protein